MNWRSKGIRGHFSHNLAILSIIVTMALMLNAGVSAAQGGKRPVVLRSFINLFHLDASRSNFSGEFRREAAEVKTLTFKLEPSECFVYPAPEGYDYLKVSDLKPSAGPGRPQLPMKTFVVQLAKDAQVYGVEVIDGLVREIDGELSIVPAPQLTIWESGAKPGRHIPDAAVYGLDKAFPGKLVSYETGKDSKTQYVFVRLFPVQYTPSRKKAVVLTEATINLYYDPAPSSEEPGPAVEQTGPQCVIICPESFTNMGGNSIAEDLMAFHNGTLSISSVIVTTETIAAYPNEADDPPFSGYKDKKLRGRRNIENYDYSLAKKIISYLRSQSTDLLYVTILGDGLLVPPSYYYSRSGGNSYSAWIPTDYFYADPGYDLTPDFRVGRISVSDALEARHVVDKIIGWYGLNKSAWFGKVYFAGGDPHTYHYLCAELNITEAINQDSFSGMNIEKCFHTDGTHTKSVVEKVFTAIYPEEYDDDAGLVYHLDHGTGYSIYLDGDDITIDDLMGTGGVPGYSDQEVPVVFSVSCGNGSFDLDLMSRTHEHSFGEAVLKSSGGGVAYIGGSRSNTGDSTWHYEYGNLEIDDTTYMIELFNYAFASYHSGTDVLGDICYEALFNYTTVNDMSGTSEHSLINLETVFRHVLLGDPALRIPQQPGAVNGYAEPVCEALYPLSYDNGIPIYDSPPTIVATADSGTVMWKLINADADNRLQIKTGYRSDDGFFYYDTPDGTPAALYLIRTAAEASEPDSDSYEKENWMYFRITGSEIEGTMYVSNIEIRWERKGPFTNAAATVTVMEEDEEGTLTTIPVSNAKVTGHWELATTDSDFGFTGADGKVTLSSDKLKNASGKTFRFVIDNVELSNWGYDSDSSVTSVEGTAP